MKRNYNSVEKNLRLKYEKAGHIRIKKPNKKNTHTGVELRISADSWEDSKRLIKDLKFIGMQPGNPYQKHKKIIVPVYGHKQIENFIRTVKPRCKCSMFDYVLQP